MQLRHESIARAINSNGECNILTFPTHERYQSNFAKLPYTFYLFQGKGIKTWNPSYAKLPKNHILLDGSENQIKPCDKFDIILSQNKAAHWQIANNIAQALNIPLVQIEHCLPPENYKDRHLLELKSMDAKVNCFISEYNAQKWKYDLNDSKVKIIHHGIDTDIFFNKIGNHNDRKILTICNDYIGRDWCLNFSLYKRICLDNKLPVNPVGDTPGLSKGAKNLSELVEIYQKASVFFNSSRISPVPTALLEAMACGCPIVTTATCMIPEIVIDGYNGFISNDEEYLKEKLLWCLDNLDQAQEIGINARQTIIEKFSLDKHLEKWDRVFKGIYGSGY